MLSTQNAICFIIINIIIRIVAKETLEPTAILNPNITSDHSQQGRALFSPRVDYNEWLPVGRGDPLKNDPTYDYSPPVLDRVRYWADSGMPMEQSHKTDILVLGVSSKKSSVKKEPKYQPIRRNFYTALPTHLRPPPMFSNGNNPSQSTGMNRHPSSDKYYQMQGNMMSGGRPSHKGSVTDVKDASSGFVNIARPSANLIKSVLSYDTVDQPGRHHQNNYGRPPSEMNHLTYTESQMLSSGMTFSNEMKEKKPFLHFLLQKEAAPSNPRQPIAMNSFQTTNVPVSQPTSTKTEILTNSFVIMPSIELTSPIYYRPTTVKPILDTTTTPFLPTLPTTSSAPTTDSLFSHYKQPELMVPGPPYLIIEGHSKVKTYGLHNLNETTTHEPKIVPIANTNDPVVRHVVSKDENGQTMEVKHLHMKQDDKSKKNKSPKIASTPSAMQSLMSLLDSSFGSFIESDESTADEKNSVKVDFNKNDNEIKLRRE